MQAPKPDILATTGCDPIVPDPCGFPFPSNVWLVADPKTATGHHVQFGPQTLPRVSQKQVDPTPWTGSDGFSPGMTLLTLGWAAEYAEAGIAANCLWPQTRIATAVVVNLLGGAEAAARSRSPEIMADAAVEILSAPPSARTGQTLIDAEVLVAAGVTDLSRYGGGDSPTLDLYVDP